MSHVLLLAGTSIARELLSLAKGLPITASLAGATKAPQQLGVPTRVRGFGGVAGLKTYINENNITHVIDATHPFATRMTANAHAACQQCNLPYLIVQRPAWAPDNGDVWHSISYPQQAANIIPKETTVFLGTGRQTLPDFANLTDRKLICRVIDPPQTPFPFKDGKFLQGRPPFSVQHEIDLFKAENIDWLVVKNAGGDASRTKLDAARQLGIPVVMIERPENPHADHVDTAQEAFEWLQAQL